MNNITRFIPATWALDMLQTYMQCTQAYMYEVYILDTSKHENVFVFISYIDIDM